MAASVLLAAGVWCAWRPWETNPSTALVLTLLLLGLTPWAVRRVDGDGSSVRAGAWAALLAVLTASVLAGRDPATGLSELALLLAAAALAWCASRTAVTPLLLRLFALGLALLTLWGLWQVTVGFGRAAAMVGELPPQMRANAAARLASGRAFASLLVPGHLAALLATALPLLVAGVRRSRDGVAWALAAALCGLGLALTYSPVGIALGMGTCLVMVPGRRRRAVAAVVAVLLAAALAAAFLARPDLVKLEPLALRADNWRTAAWVWSEAPLTGVGVGGFGQAARAVPFEVGNVPAHAHSLPLEWAAELGVIGILLAVGAALALGRLLWRLWPRAPALAAAMAVVPLANLVDFSLYSSGVALPWAVLLGWGVAMVRTTAPAPADHPRLRLAALGAASLAVGLSLLHVTSVVVERAVATDPVARYAGAVRAANLAPWRLAPVAAAGTAALQSGRVELERGALEALDDARWLRPTSASLAALASRLELALGHAPSAVSDAWLAAVEQPRVRERAAALEELVGRLEAGGGARH